MPASSKCEREGDSLKHSIGVVVGNPPFESSSQPHLGLELSYHQYVDNLMAHYPINNSPTCFILRSHENDLLKAVCSVMLQQYNFLYNQQSLGLSPQLYWEMGCSR